jgi:hypothetical protein
VGDEDHQDGYRPNTIELRAVPQRQKALRPAEALLAEGPINASIVRDATRS